MYTFYNKVIEKINYYEENFNPEEKPEDFDLSLKEIVGIEWDLCTYKDDVPGIFYINAGDNGRLYRGNADSEENVKLSDEKVSRIVLISKP